ncbi:MAG TPA: peptidoglycan DD-metalloendopeptidase family protein [Geobacteraceae bacterium]|nr:peptidoglycan DD-metalloendopeptidase family protein [Geobacteraceae bacterium]
MTDGPRCADVNEELRGINKEIREKRLLLKKTRKVETQVNVELKKIGKDLQGKEASLAVLQRDLKGAETSLTRTQQEIEAVREDTERKKQQIKQRLSALYKAGEIGGVRVYFSSESFPQMMENMHYMKAVLTNDRNLFGEYNSRIGRLKLLRSSQEGDVERKEKIKINIEAKKREIVEVKEGKAAYLRKLGEDKKTYLASLKELQANARRLQTMVERLEARRRKGYTVKKENKPVGGASLLPIPDKGFGALKGRLSMPTKGEITDGFGRHKHPDFNSYTVSNGITIAAPQGADVRSVYDGHVIFADYFKGYGNMVIVDHGGGFFSLYAHTARIVKKVGTTVARNEVIASVGDADSTRGPMLYFEIRYQGKPVDPSPWLK